MEMKNKVELVKRLDEHECVMTWSASSPATFVSAALDDFRAFVTQKIKEMEELTKFKQPAAVSEAPKSE